MTETVLRCQNIESAFWCTRSTAGILLLNADASGLVGENGAGKSTLMNILGGVFPPDRRNGIERTSVCSPESC